MVQSAALETLSPRRRPYRVEYTGSLPTSEVKRRRARLVLGWGTAREDLRVLPAFQFCACPVHTCACPLSRCRAPSQVWDAHGSIFPIFISPPRGGNTNKRKNASRRTLPKQPRARSFVAQTSSPALLHLHPLTAALRYGRARVAPGPWDLCFANSMHHLVGTVCERFFSGLACMMPTYQCTSRIRYSLAG